MIRELSYSEIATALDCEYKHAFAYTGRLTQGDALKRKTTAPALRDGRAWGQGLAAYYAQALQTDGLPMGHNAIDKSLDEDGEEQEAAGLFLPDERRETATRLHAMLDHHAAIVDPLPIGRLEEELLVALPSRTSRRRSNRYRLRAFFDGIHIDDDGRTWIFEAKLRRQLRSYELIVLSPQLRFYAWAYQQATGTPVTGMIVEERLNDLPKPVAFNKDGRPSKRQSCTPAAYDAACFQVEVEPDPDVLQQLREKRWFQRQPVIFRTGEIDETAGQLISASRLIHELDTGLLEPIRNPSPARCPGCPFRDICAVPMETDLVDALYDRRPPKRDRNHEENNAAVVR